MRIPFVSSALLLLAAFFLSACGSELPPTAPTGLIAQAQSPAEIKLTWNAPTGEVAVAGYRVYRIINGVNTDYTYHGQTEETPFPDKGLYPETEYCYKVTAYSKGGAESFKSNEACATTKEDIKAPDAPTGLVANAVSGSQIDLSWTASTDDGWVAGYKVYDYNSIFNSVAYNTSVITNAASFTGLSESTGYCYKVSAYDLAGNESDLSAEACTTTLDITAPTVSIDTITPLTSVDTQTIGGTMESGATVTISVDTTATVGDVTYPSATTWSCTITGLLEGANSITVTATDDSGNEATATATITYDTTALITTASPSGGLHGSFVDVTLTPNRTATIYYTVDFSTPDEDSNVYTDPIPITGTTTLKFFAVDGEGNVETVKVEAYTLDFIAPTGSITIKDVDTGSTIYALSPSVTLDLSAEDTNGVAEMMISNSINFDGGYEVWEPYTGTPTTKEWTLPEEDGEKYVFAKFKDNADRESGPVAASIILDTVPPSVPTGLTASADSDTSIKLEWNASTDAGSGVAGYRVYDYDTGDYISIPALTNSASDIELTLNTPYCYMVSAYDNTDKESVQSTKACATTWEFQDTQSPDVPAGLAATAVSPYQINLSWNTSTDNPDPGGIGVEGYKIYRDDDTYSAPIASTSGTSYSDAGLTNNTGYCYKVTAYDKWSPENESGIALSTEECATTLTWIINPVDSTGDVGYTSSIAVDSQGNAHISYDYYEDLDLKYATNKGGSWVTNTIDSAGDVGWGSSIAVDKSDTVHISYLDDADVNHIGNLAYITNATGDWVTTVVDDSGNVVWDSSIALDSSDSVHTSYYDYVDINLNYATNSGGSGFTSTIVDSFQGGAMYLSIALDSGNNVHISYYDPSKNLGDLKYATNAGGSGFTNSTVDSATDDTGKYNSIAVDSNNNIHISYYDATFPYGLKYATNAGGSWEIITIDGTGDVGLHTSIAVDSNDKVHISYVDGDNWDLKYATNASGEWKRYTVDSTSNVGGEKTSIAIGPDGRMHISYYDATNENLMYAHPE